MLAFTFLVAGAFFVGCSPVFVRWSELAPIPTAFYRVGLAFPLFGVWYVWEGIIKTRKTNELAYKAISLLRKLKILIKHDKFTNKPERT